VILQRYILRELVSTFLFTCTVLILLFLLGMTFQTFRTFETGSLGVLVSLVPLTLPNAASWAMLVAACPSVTLVYGRLASDNEINAMRICGLAPARIFYPALLFGLCLVGGSYALQEYVIPQANFRRRIKMHQLLREVLQSPPGGNQRFVFGAFRLGYTDCSNGVMSSPYIAKFQGSTLEAEYFAVTGRMVLEKDLPPRMILTSPTVRQYDRAGKGTDLHARGDFPVEIHLGEVLTSDKRPENMTEPELWEQYYSETRSTRRAWIIVTLYSRYAQSLAILILVIVSVPIGIYVSRGSRLAGLGAALPPLVLYLVLFFAFQGLGMDERVPPLVGSFAPDAIMAAVACPFVLRILRT
jgi:lipopolysaccharide export system permease protein